MTYTRQEMIDRMVEQDIDDIHQEGHGGGAFTHMILLDGWVGYNKMTDEQIRDEYRSREFDD